MRSEFGKFLAQLIDLPGDIDIPGVESGLIPVYLLLKVPALIGQLFHMTLIRILPSTVHR